MARVWRMLRRRSVVVAVCLVAAWAGLMGSPGDDGVVYAIGNDLWDDGFACFVSGPTRDLGYVDGKSQQDAQGFGEDGGYVLERQDLFALLGESYGKTRQTADNWSYFNRGFAQAVDWLFAMYPEDVMFDGHGDSLPTLDDQMYDFFLWSGAGSVWPAVCGSECHIGKDDDLEIKIGGDRVYDKMGHYLDQRAVARYYQEPVRSFVAAWYDPRAPEGGLRINEAAVQADAQELNERFVEATSGSAVRGNRIISGTNEVPYVLVNGSFGSTCTGGGSTTCTVDSSFDSTQEMATVQQVSVDQTNDEQFQQEVDDDLQTGNVEAREGNPSGYATLGQEDTGEDTIFVSLVLDSTYRRDFAFEVSGEDGGKKRLWAFGREPWTYANVAGMRDGRDSDWSKYQGLDLQKVKSTDAQNVTSDSSHYGYRQPTIGSAFTTEGDEKNYGTDYVGAQQVFASMGRNSNLRVERRRGGNVLQEEWRRVRWPVNFEDLNWYLYELPGANFYDPLSLFWLSSEGISGLVGSGFVHQQVQDWSQLSGGSLGCGFPDENGDLLSGPDLSGRLSDVGVVDGVDCEGLGSVVWGGSGATIGKWDRGEIEGDGYRDNVGFFPFQVKGNIPVHGSGSVQGADSPNEWSGDYGHHMFPLDKYAIDGKATTPGLGGDWSVGIVSRLMDGAGGGRKASDASGEVVLVKAGVERPVDADGAVGRRALNRFDFVIDEAEQFASHSITQLDADGLRRFGFPKNPKLKRAYVAQWPFQPISPNRPYLLVFTYYEVAHADDIEFEMRDEYREDGNKFHEETLRVPERHIRRVLCRAVVLPSGYSPVVPTGGWRGAIGGAFATAGSVVASGYGKAAGAVGEAVEGIVGTVAAVVDFLTDPAAWMIQQILGGMALVPKEGAERGVGLACDSAAAVDQYMEPRGGAGAEPATLVRSDGVLVENPGHVAKQEFDDDCLEQGSSVGGGVSPGKGHVCLPVERLGGVESCAELPRFRLIINGQMEDQVSPGTFTGYTATWRDPDPANPVEFDNRLVDGEDAGQFDFVSSITEAELVARGDGVVPGPYNMGLTRVRVGFAYEWNDVPDGIRDGIDGFVVEARPDSRAWSTADQGVLGDRLPIFYLPVDVQVYPSGSAGAVGRRIKTNVDGFYFGSMEDSSVYETFDAGNCAFVEFGTGDLIDPEFGCVLSLGAEGTQDQLDRFISFLDELPVAPSFEHSFRVRAFRGQGPPGQREVGPWSEWVVVNGSGRWACDVSAVPDHVKWAYNCGGVPAPVGADPSDNQRYYGGDPVGLGKGEISPVAASTLASISGYRFSLPLAQMGGATGLVDDSELRVGLLDLSGTEICGDLFSSTPSSLTWDNKAVHYGWRMTWVLAGSVLFVLLVWQGLRMTYDTWLVGRVSTAIRDMLPRFLIALILAAGSLFLCRMIIILVSDLTCFVAHSTGMTFWGVLGNSFVNVMKGYGQLFTNGVGQGAVAGSIAAGILIKFKLFVLFCFLVFWITVIIVMMFRVAYHMMMRLALIAVCIVMSPLAFALYASPDTAHWTGKWLRLFFGALAQQAVTLIVLYVGANFIRGVDAEGFGEWGEILMASFLVIAMLALAIKVPRIINPEAEGYFSEFSGLLRMGTAAAMFVANAVSGGLSALGGGGTFTTGMAGGGGTPSAGGPAAGTPLGGGPGGGGSGPGGGGAVGGGWFARAGSAVGGALRTAGRGVSGGLGGQGYGGATVGRFMQGMGEGARRGQRMNNMMRNITEGNFMYRNMGVGDDSANRMDDLTSQLGHVWPAREGEQEGQQEGSRSPRSARRIGRDRRR